MKFGASVTLFIFVCGISNVFCEPYECGRRNCDGDGGRGRGRCGCSDGGGFDRDLSSEESDRSGRSFDRSGGEEDKEKYGMEHSDMSECSKEEHFVNCPEPSENEWFSEAQRQNKKLINRAILWGINQVCKVELDNPILAASGEGELDKITITLSGIGMTTNQTTFPISQMDRLNEHHDTFKSKNTTFVIVNGWPDTYHLSPVKELAKIGNCRRDVAAIILNIGKNLPMVYNTLNNNSEVIAYLIYRLVKQLLHFGLDRDKLCFVGSSIGAQILAITMTMINKDGKHCNDKLEKFIGLDPTVLCKGANFITDEIANQVIIIHGDSERYGIKESIGTVNVFPNGAIGLQPGCDSYECSHSRPILLFVEAVCKPNSIIVVKCRSWKDFAKGRCVRGEKFEILRIPVYMRGDFYFRTGKHSEYGLGMQGCVPYREFCFD